MTLQTTNHVSASHAVATTICTYVFAFNRLLSTSISLTLAISRLHLPIGQYRSTVPFPATCPRLEPSHRS